MDKTMNIGRLKLFATHIGPEYAWAQCEAAGWSVRVGRHAWVLGDLDYRRHDSAWPDWARFSLTLHRYEPGSVETETSLFLPMLGKAGRSLLSFRRVTHGRRVVLFGRLVYASDGSYTHRWLPSWNR